MARYLWPLEDPYTGGASQGHTRKTLPNAGKAVGPKGETFLRTGTGRGDRTKSAGVTGGSHSLCS